MGLNTGSKLVYGCALKWKPPSTDNPDDFDSAIKHVTKELHTKYPTLQLVIGTPWYPDEYEDQHYFIAVKEYKGNEDDINYGSLGVDAVKELLKDAATHQREIRKAALDLKLVEPQDEELEIALHAVSYQY